MKDQKVWYYTDCPEDGTEDGEDETEDGEDENADGEKETETSVPVIEICFDVEKTEVYGAETSKPEKLKLYNGLHNNYARLLLDDLNPKTTCGSVRPYGWFRVTFDHDDGVSKNFKATTKYTRCASL